MKIKLSGWVMGLVVALAGQWGLGATYYWNGGSSDIPNGTALQTALTNLSGTWNTTTKNWAVDDAGATYTNWNNAVAGNHAYFGMHMTNWANNNSATSTLSGGITLERLSVDFDATNGFVASFYLTAATPVSLTLNGSNPRIFVDNNILYEGLT